MSDPISTIEDIVRVHARTRPDQPISIYDGEAASYRAMDRRSSRVANALRAAGIGVQSRVAIIERNGHALFETLFGARKIGAVQVAVNWRLSPAEIAYIINDSDADLVFVGPDFLPGLRQLAGALTRNPRIIVLGPGDSDDHYERWLARQDERDPGVTSGPDDVALQLYTSGTTGRPKGAMLTNKCIFAFIEAAKSIFGTDPEGRHLNCLPLFHVGGINWALQAMAQGAQNIGFRDFDSNTIVKAISTYRATHLMTVPAVIQMLLAVPEVRQGDCSALRAIIYGGSTISTRVLRDALATFKCGFYGMYGATELSFGNTLLSPDEHDFEAHPDLITSCGRPFEGTRLKIVDPATLEEVPDGTPGEVWLLSPQRAKGYWKQPAATAETFRADGWYRSGDIGYVRNSYLHLSDRLNDMVVSGGENVYPAEVERALHEHPDIAEAVAFGIPDAKWGEAVAAIVIMQPGAAFDEAALIDFARQRLAHYKCPRTIREAKELPRTASGKVQRHVLREPFWAGKQRRIN